MPKSGSHAEMAEPRRWIPRPLSASDRIEFPIVAIGASAGGLEACKRLLSTLPSPNGMAFVVVQHLDPGHENLLVDLLALHTSMSVAQAVDGATIERENVYVIPPGVYLSVDDKGLLRLSKPTERHGARLPFDFLLMSMAKVFGARLVAVVMSGTGADGSGGLKAVKAKGALVIAQEIAEADYDGMPRSAIATGAVDHVLPAAKIAAGAGGTRARRYTDADAARNLVPTIRSGDLLPEIVTAATDKDGSRFQPLQARHLRAQGRASHGHGRGSVCRRISRPAARDGQELDELSRDLLINVTTSFEIPPCSNIWQRTLFRGLLRDHPPERPLRIWVAGCSSGEEAYSLAILFREQIIVSKREIKLQIFASDVDPDAVATAREGLYPAIDRSQCLLGAPCAVLFARRSVVSSFAGIARQRRLHGARCARRSAIRPPRFHFVPQSSDLPEARSASQSHRGSSTSPCAKADCCWSAMPRL